MNVLDAALYTRLQSTSGVTSLLAGTTAIYHLRAPKDQAYPYIVFSIQGGGDENQTSHRTKALVYFVRAYAANSAAQAGSVDQAVDTALHLVPLTVTGWSNFWLAREADLEIPETTPQGETVYMSGGLYRLRTEKN